MGLALLEWNTKLPTGRIQSHQEVGLHILRCVSIGVLPSGGSYIEWKLLIYFRTDERGMSRKIGLKGLVELKILSSRTTGVESVRFRRGTKKWRVKFSCMIKNCLCIGANLPIAQILRTILEVGFYPIG